MDGERSRARSGDGDGERPAALVAPRAVAMRWSDVPAGRLTAGRDASTSVASSDGTWWGRKARSQWWLAPLPLPWPEPPAWLLPWPERWLEA